jgi:hypothetical protein
LVRMLNNSNVTTYEAEDGMHALEVFRQVHPHVVWTCVKKVRSPGYFSDARDHGPAMYLCHGESMENLVCKTPLKQRTEWTELSVGFCMSVRPDS